MRIAVGAAASCAAQLALCLTLPSPAWAERIPSTGPLTMELAVELALERSLALRAAAAEADLVSAQLVGARKLSPHNPELSGGAGVRMSSGGPTAEAEAGIAQAFELGRPRGERIAVARARAGAASERLAGARLRLISEARQAYVEAVAAGQLHRLAKESESLARRLQVVAEERGAADAATDLEVNLAAIEWSEARRELAAARRRKAEAHGELARVLALPRRAELVVPAEVPSCPPVAAKLDDLVVQAVQARHQLKALGLEVEAAEAEVALAMAEGWPHLEVSATYALEEGQDHIVGLGLSIPLPLFDRNQGRIAQGRAALDRSRLDLEQARLVAEREVDSRYLTYEAAAESSELLDEDVLSRVAQNLELLEISLAEGSVGIVEVLLVQRQLLSARREAVESRAAVHIARARLELAVGEEIE